MIRYLLMIMLAFATIGPMSANPGTDSASVMAVYSESDFEENPLAEDGDLEEYQYVPVAQMTLTQHLVELGVRFGLNLLASLLIVGVFYYRKSRRRDYFFTFMVFSTAMLMLLYIMGSVSIGIGLTLGLFAIFGIIRYRTETVPIREMTYLFVIIAMAAMNGLAPLYREAGATGMYPHFELDRSILIVMLVSNALIICIIAILEGGNIVAHTTTKLILYDRIDMIVPEKREELIADIEKRVGIKVLALEIGHVDFLKDAAFIKVTYPLQKGESNTINTLTKAKKYVG